MTFEMFMISIWIASGVSIVGIPFLFIRQRRLMQRLALQEATIETLKAIVANGDAETFQKATKQLSAPKAEDRVPVDSKVRLAEIALEKERIRLEAATAQNRDFWRGR